MSLSFCRKKSEESEFIRIPEVSGLPRITSVCWPWLLICYHSASVFILFLTLSVLMTMQLSAERLSWPSHMSLPGTIGSKGWSWTSTDVRERSRWTGKFTAPRAKGLSGGLPQQGGAGKLFQAGVREDLAMAVWTGSGGYRGVVVEDQWWERSWGSQWVVPPLRVRDEEM